MLSLYAISPSYPVIQLDLRPPNFPKQSILIHYVLLAMGHRDNKELEPFLIYSHMYTGASKLGMADVLQLTGRREIVQITSEVFIIT